MPTGPLARNQLRISLWHSPLPDAVEVGTLLAAAEVIRVLLRPVIEPLSRRLAGLAGCQSLQNRFL